ncbi:hypothetical protein [Synechococcus sp. UW140]|uniref:hypothetical protein n=1 Tax=Synechococcus sp. UW140 TaxID=368503 RepID=UPI0025FA990A|nr:hypothetical protein [Synechococcus sp. UW140]
MFSSAGDEIGEPVHKDQHAFFKLLSPHRYAFVEAWRNEFDAAMAVSVVIPIHKRGN